MSLYLFVLCMDMLSQWINPKVAEGVWKPLQASRGAPRVSHLMFADDIIFFAQATTDQVDCIRDGLHQFCGASGQSVNLHKSSMFFSPNQSEQQSSLLSLRMGIPKAKELGVYLGHQLVHHGNNKRVFDGLLQRVRQRLQGWKSKCLSRAGRITLAQTVINSMVVYQMQFQKLLVSVHKELDKSVRRCVWRSTEEKRELHLISCDVLCRPKVRRGVGLKCSVAMDKSSLSKLAWRLFHEEDTIWSRMIRAKYCISLDEPPTFKPKARSLVIWRGLCWGSELLHRGKWWHFWNGRHTIFWGDRWLVDQPLGQGCWELLTDEEAQMTVRDLLEESLGWKWQCVSSLLSHSNLLQLSSTILRPTDAGRDIMHWLKLGGRFSVRSAYELEIGGLHEG